MATISRSFLARYKFRQALQFDFRNIPVEVTGIDIRGAFTVQWMTQIAEVGASKGMYDYLRKLVIVGPGAHQFHLTVNSETWGEPVSVDEVPSRLLIPMDQRQRPGHRFNEMTLGMIKNLPQSDPNEAPDLDSFLVGEETVDEP